MSWRDYEAAWKRQELPVGPEADLAQLHATFDAKHRKQAAAFLLRDYAEASAGIAVSVALAFIWGHQKKVGWPIGLAIVLTLGVTGIFIRERIRAHRRRLEADSSMLARLDADIAELGHQRRLLLSVWQWYLAPLATAIVIVCVTISLNRPPWDLSRDPAFLGGYFAFVALLIGVAWHINRRAVRRQIDPRIAELEKLRRDILAQQ